MPMWRCPHCGTPQAESSRCWVCKRSSTSCGTCRHFRRAIAGQLGFCGLDRLRQPLRGDERRGCWEAAPVAVELPETRPAPNAARPATPGTSGAADTPARPRVDFVEVDLPSHVPAARARARASSRTRGAAPAGRPANGGRAAALSTPATPDPVLGFWAEER